jgi:hypothetical protein
MEGFVPAQPDEKGDEEQLGEKAHPFKILKR